MGNKANCWEVMECHHPNCTARTEKRLNDIHGGVNAGRACWVVAGTRCRGEVQGEYAQKFHNCSICKFYLRVQQEEGGIFKNTLSLLNLISTPTVKA